jgi:plastocyanin
MNKFYFLIFIGALITIPFLDKAFAATYDINMPTGSSFPNNPYFWQNEKTGEATGDIEILVGDTVVWKNGDQAKHTITSGTVEGGHDDIFGGSKFIVAGDTYKFQFDEKGQYPYFCIVHPWMIGVVTVTNDGYKLVPDVGKDIGDGLTSFNLDYQYSGIISHAMANEEEKSITFQLESNPKSLDQTLVILIPSKLLDGPYAIFEDGKKNLRFEHISDEVNTIEIELSENPHQLKIIGTKIVPEFGIFSIIILGMAITGMIFISRSRIHSIY